MKTIRVCCTACKGAGTVELNGEYLLTYQALKKSGETWAAALAPALNCNATAASNRLAGLEAKGLATSRRWGKKRLFKAVEGVP